MGDEAEHVPLHGLFLCGAVLHRGHHPSLLHDGQGVLLCAVSWPRVPPALVRARPVLLPGTRYCELLLWGATPPWQVAISSCPVRVASCLICSWISSSSAASAVRLSVCAVSRHKALVLCIVSRCLCATRG